MESVVAILRPHAEKLDELLNLLADVHRQTIATEGTLMHSVSVDGEGRVIVLETYATPEARDAHFASGYTQRFVARFPELLAERAELVFAAERMHWSDRPADARAVQS